MRPTGPRGWPVDGRGVGLVLPEGPVRCRLAPAVGEDHREVRDDERARDRDRSEPPEMVDEHQNGRGEADRPDAHHDEVAALAVRDVRRQARTRFSDQVGLVTAGSSGGFHISTLCRCQPRRQRGVLHSVGEGSGRFAGRRRASEANAQPAVSLPLMTESPLSAQDVRAAAEVHRELGPDYGDAVVESFLAKIDQQIEARVDQQLASLARPARRPVDPVRLSKWRFALAGAAAGSVVVGLPLTLIAASALSDGTGRAGRLIWIWVVLVVIYGLAAYRLRRR